MRLLSRNYENISCNTICSRAKQGNLAWFACGVPSPLSATKDALVLLAIAMAQVRQPITPIQGITLVNSLIQGTSLQQKLLITSKIKVITKTKQRRNVDKWEWVFGEDLC